MAKPTAAEIRAELIERGDKMTDTEFSVKRQKLVAAGGWWPGALSDWSTDDGRALADEIRKVRRG